MSRPQKIHCVSFLISNPPNKDDWDWVDSAVEDETEFQLNGDFGDGCTATYEFKDDADGALKFLDRLQNCLKKKKTIGKNRKFRISNLKIYTQLPIGPPNYWKDVPFER